jgi:hypothetical protein
MTTVPVGVTAPAASERSWLPTLPMFQPFSRMWYGDPLMPLAELPIPQSLARAMWPPRREPPSGVDGEGDRDPRLGLRVGQAALGEIGRCP